MMVGLDGGYVHASDQKSRTEGGLKSLPEKVSRPRVLLQTRVQILNEDLRDGLPG